MRVYELPGIDNLTEDDCTTCCAAELAEKHLPVEKQCPYCKHTGFSSEGIKGILETNADSYTQNVFTGEVFTCSTCHEPSVAAMRPIQYNANHDVYYTGGDHYSPDWHDMVGEIKIAVTPSINQFYERQQKEPGRLDNGNLALWIAYAVGPILARRYRELWEKMLPEAKICENKKLK